MALIDEIKKIIKGDIDDNAETLTKYSHDASLFEIKPQAVVFPKDVEDVKALVKFTSQSQFPKLSLTARSGGTDMTGGPLNESLILDFTRYFNKFSINIRTSDVQSIHGEPAEALAEAGVWYRDFEKEAMKRGYFLPSYPASKEICAVGGMVNNNSGGEKTLKYGKTENYVTGLKIVLSDGNEYQIKKLSKAELDQKMKQENFEGEVYKKTFQLLDENYNLVQKSRPRVSKNSTGYNIWDVWDREKGVFDLTKLFVGSQGTLGMMIEAELRLIRAKSHSGVLVIFMKSLERLPEIIKALLPLGPVSMESFDDHTFKLAVKFFFGFAGRLGLFGFLRLGWQLLPDIWRVITGGVPKLVVLAEFEGDSQKEVDALLERAQASFESRDDISLMVARTKAKAEKYWLMRRESFNLLRQKVRGLKTAPFIDDLIIQPDSLLEFLPKLYKILDRYRLLYTIAGHAGDGNFHIIPLMKLEALEEREKIPKVMDEVYRLVFQYRGSISAEHNDGLIRSPYLPQMYGPEIYRIFEEIKKIFDPQNIFNPGKKVGADLKYALEHIKI